MGLLKDLTHKVKLNFSLGDLPPGFRDRPEEFKNFSREIFKVDEPRFLSHPGLEVTTVFVSEKGDSKPRGILKAAPETSNQSLAREFEILTHVFQNSSPSFRSTIPEPLGLKKILGLPVLALSFVEGERKKTADFEKVLSWTSELGRIPAPPGKKKTSRFREARERIKHLAPRHAHTQIKGAVERALKFDDPEISAKIPTVVTHRDLAPTNLLFSKGELRVVDWGNAHYGWPLTDWVRFACNFCRAEDLFSGRSESSRNFLKGAERLQRELSIPPEWAAPLVLLSVFDFLESFYLGKPGNWEGKYAFILSSPEWKERLGSSGV